MEKMMKSALSVALSVGLVASAYANNGDNNDKKSDKASKLQYEVKSIPDSKKIVMGVKSEEKGDIQVRIFDNDGNRIYSEKQEDTQGFFRVYDLSALNSDKYTLQLSDQNSSEKTQIDFRASANKSSFVAYFPSTFDKNVQVSYANALGNVNLTVARVNGEKVFEADLAAQTSDSFIANLSALNKGLYEIKVSNGGQTYSRQVSIK